MADRWTLSVVAPCYNEQANLPTLAERLFHAAGDAGIPTELVIVDDGSTDGTWRVAGELADFYGEAIIRVRHPINRGIPAGWRSGVDAARGTYVCLIDADLQNPPEEVVTLYRRLVESPFDLAQGTRSSIGRLRDSRLFMSRILNTALNWTFGMRATDNKSGFVLGPKRVLDDVLTHRKRYRQFQTFVTVAAKAKGYSILEVETLFESRYAGTSFLDQGAGRIAGAALADFVPAIQEFRLHSRPAPTASVTHTLDALRRRPRHPYRGWRRLWFEAYFATMPLHAWMIRRSARQIYLSLKQSEWFLAEELRALQLHKLQRLVQHTYVHVPYYRDAMHEAGITPDAIETLDDIQLLPMLSKHEVRSHLYFSLFADNHRKSEMLKVSTSGSTGEPFTVYGDRQQLEVRFATTLRALEWTGWRFGDRQARLWHQTIGLSRTQVLRERIDACFMRRLFIPAFDMNSDNLDEFIERIRAHAPVLVDGYAESLNFLATYVREGGLPGFSPRAVMSSAQILPDNVRRVIEEGFETKVFDKYGSREFSGVAYQCGESEHHHVMDESYIVEVIVDGRPAGPGEVGEVVITDLNNFSVPLIRYRIGDLATAVEPSNEPCACGRYLSKIGRIEGRTQAIVHCANGAWLPGAFFMHFFKDYEHAVRQFQVVQDQPGVFTLKIVKGRLFTNEEFERILVQLFKYVGEATRVDVEFVDEIPLVRTGKRSPVVSTLDQDFQSLGSSRSDPIEQSGRQRSVLRT